jgi:hypothetical protein
MCYNTLIRHTDSDVRLGHVVAASAPARTRRRTGMAASVAAYAEVAHGLVTGLVTGNRPPLSLSCVPSAIRHCDELSRGTQAIDTSV